uniref:Uncharacterized protein n=1 Tax=Rhizophora mucronata TaxID=61149 RepID=A0A2P2Q6W2_RHIMU
MAHFAGLWRHHNKQISISM